MAVDQSMSATVPGSSLALNEAEQMNEPCDMAYVMHNVLEPPPSDDLLPINLADRVVGDQTRFVRPFNSRLLVVHDVSNFIIVWPSTVLFDMVASGFERSYFVIRKD